MTTFFKHLPCSFQVCSLETITEGGLKYSHPKLSKVISDNFYVNISTYYQYFMALTQRQTWFPREIFAYLDKFELPEWN